MTKHTVMTCSQSTEDLGPIEPGRALTVNVVDLIPMPDFLSRIGQRLDASYQWIKSGRQEWIEGSLEHAAALVEARDYFGSDDNTFGTWLSDNGHDHVGKNDRAALIHFGRDLPRARVAFENAKRISYQHIWNDVKDGFPHVRKPAPAKTQPPPKPPIANYIAALKKFSADTKAIQDSDSVGKKAAELMSDLITDLMLDLLAVQNHIRQKLKAVRRIKTIGPDDDPPWRLIKRPGPRMTGGPSYVRSELGWALRRHFPTFECVTCACPCGEGDDSHDLTICYRPRRDGGDSAALTCEAGTKSDAVLEAILSEIS